MTERSPEIPGKRFQEESAKQAEKVTARGGILGIGKWLQGQGVWEKVVTDFKREKADQFEKKTRGKESGLKSVRSRRAFFRTITSVVVLGGLWGIGIKLRGFSLIKDRTYDKFLDNNRFKNGIEQGEVGWCNLLTVNDQELIRKVIERYSVELESNQPLENFGSWVDNTRLGFLVRGVGGFLDHLRSSKGRERLLDLINNQTGKMDVDGFPEAVKKLGLYASLIGKSDLSIDDLKTYFISQPNELKTHFTRQPQESENGIVGLGWKESSWNDLELVYNVAKTGNSTPLKKLLSSSPEASLKLFGLDKERVADQLIAKKLIPTYSRREFLERLIPPYKAT